ncbi:MAG: hypothetical protein U5L03_01280, partial [Burkholderiaceae bacterium]|nr:hypothetical protein [Burkholderiaceae bacterium]
EPVATVPTWLVKLLQLAPDLVSFIGALLLAYPPFKVALHNRVLTGLLLRNLGTTKLGAKWGTPTIETLREILQRFAPEDFAKMLAGLLLTALGAGLKVVSVVFG